MESADEKKTTEKMKKIILPRARAGEDKSVYVGVNGKTWQVPKGKTVDVPECVYERLMIMLDAQTAEDDYRDEIEAETRKMGMM